MCQRIEAKSLSREERLGCASRGLCRWCWLHTCACYIVLLHTFLRSGVGMAAEAAYQPARDFASTRYWRSLRQVMSNERCRADDVGGWMTGPPSSSRNTNNVIPMSRLRSCGARFNRSLIVWPSSYRWSRCSSRVERASLWSKRWKRNALKMSSRRSPEGRARPSRCQPCGQ